MTGPLDCNDDDICTEDTCDPIAGCLNTPIEGCPTDLPGLTGHAELVLILLLIGVSASALAIGRPRMS